MPGVRIIGGCCGTMPDHLRAMREALESRPKGPRPTLETISAQLGGFSSASDGTGDDARAIQARTARTARASAAARILRKDSADFSRRNLVHAVQNRLN